MFLRKQKTGHMSFDREHLVPAVKTSICTGEQVAGFKDLRTGKFRDVMLLSQPGDLEKFMEQYGVDSVIKIY